MAQFGVYSQLRLFSSFPVSFAYVVNRENHGTISYVCVCALVRLCQVAGLFTLATSMSLAGYLSLVLRGQNLYLTMTSLLYLTLLFPSPFVFSLSLLQRARGARLPDKGPYIHRCFHKLRNYNLLALKRTWGKPCVPAAPIPLPC